jgi:Family of unknown function (DUF6492)
LLKAPRQLRRRLHEIFISRLPRNYKKSNIEIVVLIPLAKKDIFVATHCIDSIKQNLLHPISRFVIIGQDSEEIRKLAKDKNIEYICENEVLGKYLDIPIIAQKGWLKQQLIKLLAFEFIDASNILVHDADTIMLRPVSYFENEMPIYYLADEYTKKYYSFIEKFFGKITRAPRSFVAHSMLLQRHIRADLDEKMRELHGKNFIDSMLDMINFENYHAFSEYEIYGNFLNHFHKGEFKTRYWYNVKNKKFPNNEIQKIKSHYKRFNSVSMHIHDT